MPEGEPIVKRYLAKTPSAQMRMAYARVLLGQQRLDEARQQLVSITVDSPDYAEAWATLAALQLQSNDVDAAQASTERFGKLVPQIRSEEHTSELQSPCNLVCRLLLEKKNQTHPAPTRLDGHSLPPWSRCADPPALPHARMSHHMPQSCAPLLQP